MQNNFTFREQRTEQIHSHRLIYVHSSAADRNQVNMLRRFKTEPQEEISVHRNGERQYLSNRKSQNLQSTRHSSQNKIKYFDLDLKNLVSNGSNSSLFISSEKKKWNDLIEQPSRNSLLSSAVQQKRKISPFETTSNQNQKVYGIHNKQNYTQIYDKGVKPSCMTNLKEMNLDGLMNKELVKELWQGVGGQSVKKIALIQKNCNEFKEKYNKLNKMNNKFYPKMTPKCFRQKKPNIQEMKQQLCVRKVEKIVIDREGHQYRITLQKLK